MNWDTSVKSFGGLGVLMPSKIGEPFYIETIFAIIIEIRSYQNV